MAKIGCRAQKPRIGPVTWYFFEFARPAAPPWPRIGGSRPSGGRHLFPEHCPVTPAPMSHLRIAEGIHQPSWERSPGSGLAKRGQGEPLVRATIGISAPFRLRDPRTVDSELFR